MRAEPAPPDDEAEDDQTLSLLRRWHGGDAGALDAIVDREREWVERRVRARLGDGLRGKAETQDFVQDALLEFLRYGPRFEIQSRRHLRGLLARIVENALRAKAVWFDRQRRRMAKERPLAAHDTVVLEPAAPSEYRPSVVASQKESAGCLRLAIELLEPGDREVIVLREWDGLSLAAVGERLGIAEDAARMRFQRALRRLMQKVRELEAGELDRAFGADA